MGEPSSQNVVTISAERLKELEALEVKYMGRLKKLNEDQKLNPEKYAKQKLEKYHKNKEVINERRRAAYKAKKEAEAAEKAAQASQG